MASKGGRIFAGFFAVLFLVTSSALAILVIYTMATQDKKPKSSAGQASQTQSSEPKNKLAGTKLAGFAPTAHIAKLQEIDLKAGSGATVQPGASVTVDYTGAVASTGVIFQSSKDTGQPVPLSLSQVITGWSQGIPGMKTGGTRRLLIPSALAYGPKPPPGSGIPANADLVFDVTVRKIDK